MKIVGLLAALLAPAVWAAELESFTPLGLTAEVRQVQARFSDAMVPIGQSGAPAPFKVECAAGKGYWIDERTWVYDLTETPPPASSCKFNVLPDLKTLAGEPVRHAAAYRFHMAGPRVLDHRPDSDSPIDESQVFLLQLDGPATPASIEENVHCAVRGIYERIPVRRLAGKERQDLLDQVDRPYHWSDTPDDRIEVLQCSRPLPANAKVALVWSQGVYSASGLPNSADQPLEFVVRDHFTAQLRCQRENTRAGCLPLRPIRLELSAQAARTDLDRITLRDAGGKTYRQEKETGRYDDHIVFPGPFPASGKLILTLPKTLRDEAGRPLINQSRFPLDVQIGALPPLVKFAGGFGIIERKAGGMLPITLRNLEPAADGTAATLRWVRVNDPGKIVEWWQRLDRFEHPLKNPPPDQRRARLLDANIPGLVERVLPKPNGAEAFEVVGVPLEKPGYYVLEAESRNLGQSLLGADAPMYVRASALVTNLSVHFKWGPANSLAWVTSLDQGKPVERARIVVSDCKGRTLARAVTNAQGMSFIRSGLPDPRTAAYDCPLTVSAQAGDDIGFVRSEWEDGIETWRFNLPTDWNTDSRIAHAVLDRTLFKPGETVHIKHLLRDKAVLGLAYPKKTPKTLMIEHEASGQRWFLPLAWTRGTVLTDWKVPDSARRGHYTLRLVDKAIGSNTPAEQLQYLEGIDSGRFNVSDFRLPIMKASVTPVEAELVGVRESRIDASVTYQSGGAARGMSVDVHARLAPRHGIRFEAWPDYDFARPSDSDDEGDIALETSTLKLDDGGSGRARIGDLPTRTRPQRLSFELEYSDPSGEIQTVAGQQNWWPADVVLGIKEPRWVKAGKETTLEFLVVDTAGKPVAGAPVSARPALRRDLSHRIRLAGGFYGYHREIEETPLSGQCQGVSDARGHFSCTISSEESGEVIVAAEARDRAGRATHSHASFWVSGKDEWWFAQDNHDRIDLISERKTWKHGEKARFQVRMPFREATVLVTVERDGILDARVVTLSGKAPVIELPVRADWSPNVFVSALVVRGRVGDAAPTALVDLGKPAFKLGIARLDVEQTAHRLDVKVASDRPGYQTREKARVRLSVKSADGRPLPEDTEVVIAAVDEALLELADNASWNPLPAMLAERGYNMRTVTAQMQVTGKRHFGKKALPPGGGGGRSATRELFDTLLYWNPSVKLDAKGQASVEIPLNDSLTRFRIVAVASAESRFGSGWTAIRSSRDLRVDSGLAPVVREGDRLSARFTVHNGSERTMQVAVGAKAGALAGLPSRQFELQAGEAREIGWNITVPPNSEQLPWQISVREVKGAARDELHVVQQVQPVIPVRQVAGQLYRLDKPLDLTLAPPEHALPGRGEVRATVSATLGDGLAGVREYMRRYPYACLEQKASKALATHDAAAWSALMEALPGYLDGNGLAAYFPGQDQGSIALTAYLLAASHDAERPLPVAARVRMETALENHLAGRLENRDARANEVAMRLAALAALARNGKATPELAATIPADRSRWSAAQLIDWIEVLKRTPALPNRNASLREAQASLRAKLTYSGSRIHFGDDGDWRLMNSADTDAVRGLLALMDLPDWQRDAPKLASGALARQSRGHWDTTTANAWGTIALDRYGKLYETTRPAGLSTAHLGADGRQIDWKAFPNGATASFPLPGTQASLKLRHNGSGAPYVTLSTLAAVDLKAPVARGYTIDKDLIAVERKRAGKWSRGDIVRVRLTVNARDDMGWVVIDDPVPAGASLLGGGLKRGSSRLTADESQSGRAWPAWQERRFDRIQSYYEHVPRGRFTLEYTLRLNNDGDYKLPPTRVEAMYAPDLYGETPNADFVVEP